MFALVTFQLVFFVAILGLWMTLRMILKLDDFVLPPVADVFSSLIRDWDKLQKAFFRTFWVSSVCYMVVGLTPFFAGGAHAFGSAVSRIFLIFLITSQAIPVVAIAPIIGLFLGVDFTFEVITAFLIAGLPVMIISTKAIQATPKDALIDSDFELNGYRLRCFKTTMRNAKGPILSVMRGCAPLAVVGAIVAEYIGTGAGLGFFVYYANITSDSVGLYSISILCCICGFIFYNIVEGVVLLFIPEGYTFD
jgi:NitT/TauT family transport system permease protein